jgi:hypothetical protein
MEELALCVSRRPCYGGNMVAREEWVVVILFFAAGGGGDKFASER